MPDKKLPNIKGESINKDNTFIELNSPAWRSPGQMSIGSLLDHLTRLDIISVIDGSTLELDVTTLKLKVNFPPAQEIPEFPEIPECKANVFSEPFNDHNRSYYQPPIDASVLSGIHLVTDENYLYIWVGNRWKRTILSEW